MRLDPLYRMVFHHRWLNDVVCVGTGEVRPDHLLIDVAELIWEPPILI